jgi:hypothetical protein
MQRNGSQIVTRIVMMITVVTDHGQARNAFLDNRRAARGPRSGVAHGDATWPATLRPRHGAWAVDRAIPQAARRVGFWGNAEATTDRTAQRSAHQLSGKALADAREGGGVSRRSHS